MLTFQYLLCVFSHVLPLVLPHSYKYIHKYYICFFQNAELCFPVHLHFPTVLLQEDPQHSHSKIFGLVIILLQFHMPQTVGLISLTPYKVHPNVHQQATPPRMVECSVDAAASCVHLNYDDNRAVGTPPKKRQWQACSALQSSPRLSAPLNCILPHHDGSGGALLTTGDTIPTQTWAMWPTNQRGSSGRAQQCLRDATLSMSMHSLTYANIKFECN